MAPLLVLESLLVSLVHRQCLKCSSRLQFGLSLSLVWFVLIPAHFQLSFDYSTTLLLYYSSTSWTTMPPKRTADTGMMKPSAKAMKATEQPGEFE